jgi:low affinity Fe/Cu permease
MGKNLWKINPTVLIIAGLVAVIILYLLGGIIVRLLQFLLVVIGTTTLVLFLALFIQNYGRYEDVDKALEKTINDIKKLYSAFLDLIFTRR